MIPQSYQGNAFMKYGLQAKIGRMDGVIVAYHNTAEIFGFQYIPLDDMERCVYGAGFRWASASLTSSVQCQLFSALSIYTNIITNYNVYIYIYYTEFYNMYI